MPTRTVSSTLLLVLLTSALFISIYSVAVPTPARAAGYVLTSFTFSSSSLLPNAGPPGTWVTFHGVLIPTPSGGYSFTCNLTASHPNFFSPLTGTAVAGKTVWTSCNVIGADVIGSFKVRDTTEISTSFQLPGLNYTINLQVTANNSTRQVVAAGLAFFKVTPKIGFSHTGSTPWYSSLVVLSTETVYVHGWGFNATSSTCTFTSEPTSFLSIATAPACSISAGELTNGQFTLIGGAATTQSINATGNTGDPTINYGAGSLGIVSAGTAIQATPKYGTPGMTVTVTGVGFSSSDTSCVLSYMNLTYGQLFSSTSTTCTLATVGTWNQPTVTFTVADTATADKNYTLRVMGFPTNDYAYTYFKLNASYPAIALTPNTGPPGTTVSVTNSTKFSAGSSGLCTISAVGPSPTTPPLISSYVCLIKPDGGMSSFTKLYVSYSTSGEAYVVTITGSNGDHASAGFLATTGPTITLNPTSGSGGDSIQVNGVKFSLGDTACTISTTNPSGSVNAVLSYSCSVSSGTVTGSFVIKTLDTPAGVYNITVTGNTGDWGSALLTVNPKITLTPSTARVADNVTVTGSNLAAADKFINFYSVPIGGVNTTAGYSHGGLVSSNFTLSSGSSFIVASNPTLGSYTITGNFTKYAQAILTITPRTVLLSPDHGPVSAWVNVTGTGFSLSDTICTIRNGTASSPVVTSAACTISGGTITGKFQVLSTATLGLHALNITGYPTGDRVGTSFIVTPAVTLNPASGAPGTVVIVLGSGFSVADTSCTISSGPSGLIANPTCAVAGGVMSGSFTVASGATGSYLVFVTGSSGDVGSAVFNRRTPSLTLAPTSGVVGTAVTASGSNFWGTSCMLSSVPSNLFTSQACLITAGTLNASFTVASGATGGYTVWAQTNAGPSDSATAIFTVGVTTTTTPTTTVTLPTTTTLTTALTTTTRTTSSITTSISSTTFSTTATTTGPWTPPKCVIATATFGSEASPAVQFLRNFRDRLVLSTTAGSAFMQVFNAWYYSFSPSVAQFIANNDPIRAPIRVLLYPLLGILGLSAFAYSLFSGTPEFAVVMAGLVASSLIGLTYFTAPALIGMQALLRKRRISARFLAKVSLASLAIALTMLAIGEVAGSFLILAIASSAVVLICVIAVPTIVAFAMLHPNRK